MNKARKSKGLAIVFTTIAVSIITLIALTLSHFFFCKGLEECQ
ncbi:hypothetical protein [endosymbiont 'TC1' of Trimyema compressum]|nr:hypothetical protein [endosymbiont 'TC1' of Trimyema compressum]